MDILKNNVDKIEKYLTPYGYECHIFKVAWYNENVLPSFKLKHPDDTAAIVVLSTPQMYEKSVKPYIIKEKCMDKDPVDACIAEQLKAINKLLPEVDLDILFDYELDHMRRPRILVQTAGHVAGAARYYQRKDLTDDPWDDKKKIYGVSIHPTYGGWFAFRGVLVLKNVLVPDLDQPDPPDPVPRNEDRVELLRRFNECWQDWTFRDIIPTKEQYSEEQKLYFATLPKDRTQLVEKLKAEHQNDVEKEQTKLQKLEKRF